GDDDPCQQPSRRSLPHRDHGPDGEPEPSRNRPPQPDLLRHSHYCSGVTDERWLTPGDPHYRGDRHQRRHHQPAGHLLVRKTWAGAEWKLLGRFRATGIVPKFAEKLKDAGLPLAMNLLEVSQEV